MKNIVLLGSTGSIGRQTLSVVRKCGMKVLALSANSNIDLLEQQLREFKPRLVAVMQPDAAKELRERTRDIEYQLVTGIDGLCEAAALEGADVVLNSVVGMIGLRPTLAAIAAGNDVALANKETLVAGGDLVMAAAKKAGVQILPVDSEHSAIFQSLLAAPRNRALNKIILTASGGPFFGRSRAELRDVTVAQALKHPNWSMGAKITIDSATLMNKGLEVIEAVHLFGVSPDSIEVVVHRESILHSAVEFDDGAVIGQLGAPDMSIPIQFALTYPDRFDSPSKRLSLTDVGQMTFYKPDMETFRCLRVCIDAIKAGGLRPAAANGANEQAVALFLSGKIKFLQIAELVEAAAESQPAAEVKCIDDVLNADAAARQFVLDSI
ncbi:MAG: 1-deoxy-D-xylulose-5-phosphate reductoisomerase [Firmicutes bacterium]|nr:1-deoxy-D-xylulose-5-phosphate reductoisomerase [Bacillota bacterium]